MAEKSGLIRWNWFWLTVIWAATLASLSSITSKQMPHWSILAYDKLFHLGFYAPLGFFLMATFARRMWFRYGCMLLVVMLYGCSDEIHQHFVPGRTMDVWDWMFDTVGGAIGGAIFLWWEHLRDKFTLKHAS